MYLKSLVLKGFKSFADRSVLALEPGIIAVVGPNGSGKSNISDAVLWVLGERNAKHLRGQAMEDVIFAGSSARKSVGIAEVDLVLDNSDGTLPVDFDEVAVTRRMYRSGESEYLITAWCAPHGRARHPARLRAGTGTHSIISQGSLDSILQSKPEDRRALIEEAAGVLKHKQRKAKSERKLAAMDAHLARVKDVAAEVERQLGPLERKAKRARTYQGLADELADLSLSLAVDDLRTLRRGWDDALARERALEAELEEKRAAIAQAEASAEELQEKIRRLESNILVFPAEVENARNKIQRGLEKQGIQTEVHIFAELVQEVTAPEWRKAVETFLGRKRFYIIVDGAHCYKAMQILQKERIYDGNVVITDKLPETEAVEGSAAEILRIPNVYARRYANYLLNGIHLCENLEELHEYPKGGLMRDGMLAKSYAVAMMDMRRTELCLGADAIRCQLEQSRKELEELQVVQRVDKEALSQVIKYRDAIKEIDWDGGHYDFGAAYGLKDCGKRRDSLVKDREEIEANPDFTAVLKELETAGRLAREANESVNQNQSELGGCKNDLKGCEGTLGRISTEIYLCQKAYEEKCLVNMELKEAMLEEYNRESEKRGTLRVTTQLSIDKSKNMLAERERQLEDAQLAYCRLAGIDVGKRGIGYIPWYREEYRNLAHVKVEEAQQKLQEQAGRLESAFMNDFVAEIDENVREAKREMDAINRELRHMPFGNDTYKFVMKEKPDRALFFRICRSSGKIYEFPAGLYEFGARRRGDGRMIFRSL